MKRDLSLIRKIVLAVEDAEGGSAPAALAIEGYDQAQIGYHAHLLIDAGIARGFDVTNLMSPGPEALITDLTWAGHEFAELARDDNRWQRVMAVVNSKGGGLLSIG